MLRTCRSPIIGFPAKARKEAHQQGSRQLGRHFRIGVDPTNARVEALRDLYVECLRSEIVRPNPGHPSLVLPGVVSLLDALAKMNDVAVALLTWPSLAEKLNLVALALPLSITP